MSPFRKFVDANIRWSRRFDALLPATLVEDGNKWYIREYLPKTLCDGITVYNLGGGSQPYISRDDKERHNITLIGLDIDARELAAAPPRVYDRTIVADLCDYSGVGDADAVVCMAVLEHLRDVAGATRAIASTLKPGGRAFIFAPSRNALFARLNKVLPQEVKRRILYALLPGKSEGHDGFVAYYDRCTPSEFEALARENGLEIEERRLFWISSYFSVFAPAYIAWRVMQGLAYLALRDDAAETFAYVLRKPDLNPEHG
jgi:SAM-dependent methyltransferase